MRQAAQLLREEQGPVKPDVRSGLARLLEAVADQQGAASTYVWSGANAVANTLNAQPLDQSIGTAIEREREGIERARTGAPPT
jgi:hypothetical protein